MTRGDPAHYADGNGHGQMTPAASSFVGRDVLCHHAWSKVARALALSPQEAEIVVRLFDDLSETAIANQLGISAHTVHAHLRRIYRKVNVASRVQLAIQILSGLVPPCDQPRCRIPP